MPDFWQFPTVSMGLGPLMAIYQARFMKYLQGRGLADTTGRKVWAFMGDGEMDEPESLGAISLAGREQPRQPDLRHQLQPAAPRRPGARQRQDHPGARDQLPRRRLERHQGRSGAAAGTRCWPPTTTGACSARMEEARRRRVPDLQVARRRLRPRALLRRRPGAARDGRGHDRRRDLGAQPRRPRPAARSTPPTRRRPRTPASRR